MAGGLQINGPGGNYGELATAMLGNPDFMKTFAAGLEPLLKADTISQSTNLMWYDLSQVVQMLYP
jgi:hypothetical protein